MHKETVQEAVLNSQEQKIERFRACSYDPACRDVSLTETNISVRSYGIFQLQCTGVSKKRRPLEIKHIVKI